MSNLAQDRQISNQPAPIHLVVPPIAPSGVELHHLLRDPEIECDLEAFANAVTVQDIIFECEGDGPMAQHPGFPGAIRQVIGSELMKTASKEALGGVPCPWGPACGLHVFFNGQRGDNAMDMPPPWIIRSETTGADSLRITLRLFGLGLLWSSELSEACHRAIERGVRLSGKEQICQSVLIRSVESVWTDLQDQPPSNGLALVSFVTPFGMPEDADIKAPGQQLLTSLMRRCVDVARWHGIKLATDWPNLENREKLVMNEKGLGQIEWNRCLSQQGGPNIAMKGQMGLLQLHLDQGDNRSLVRLLQIGALLHTGDNIAFGQGRFDLYLTPQAKHL